MKQERLAMSELMQRIRNKTFSKRVSPDLSLIDEEKRMIPFILVSNDNAGERYDYWEGRVFVEEIDVNGVDTSELRTFFKDHRPSVDTAIGRVENARVESGSVKADVYFGSDEDSLKIFNKYKEGILSDVSIGYDILETVETERKGEPTHVLVTKCSVHELSAVWKGFDKKATIGRSQEGGESVDEVHEISGAESTVTPISILIRKLNLKTKGY